MPKPVAEVGEGHEDASGNGVYCFIRDLIVEGRDARFVDKRGRYVINWSRALKCYHDYKSKRNPQYKSKNINRRKASNGLRAALLNFYKKEGAKEYKDCKKVNEKDEVVERQFQMPPRVFESLFGSDVQLSDDSSEHETSSITSEADEKPLATPNSSDSGFDEAMDISDDGFNANEEPSSHCALGGLPTDDQLCSNVKTEEDQVDPSDIITPCQMFDISEEELDLVIGEICSNSDTDDIDLLGVVRDICPSSGSVKGGMQFYISLTEELLEDDKSGIAHFDGIGDVSLERLNCYTLAGTVPASQQPGPVPVTVNTQDGRLLGMTYFMYVDEIQEVLKQVVKDPALQSLYLTMWSQEHGFFGSDGNLGSFTLQDQGSSIQGTHAQALKGLQLLVYTAAQTNAQQFIQMIFSTSAGRLIFNAYKDRPQLPEDVARANGHDDLAQYLHDVNTRLSKESNNDAQPSSIDWSELIEAVNKIQKQASVIEDETDLEIGQSKDDDNQSDYFADVETSSCGSFELEIGWSDSEGPCSKVGGSDKKPDVKSPPSMNVMPCKAYMCAEMETQSDNDLDLEDNRNNEKPATVNSKPMFRPLRKRRRGDVATSTQQGSCVKEVCEIECFGQQIGFSTHKRDSTSEREQEARACLDQEKCMSLKSPFTKDERPKKEPDERLTPSMEGKSSEAPTVFGTSLDDEMDQKAEGKNDRKLGTTEVGKSSLISQLSKKVAASGREEEASTVPSQEKTTKSKRTWKWLKGDAVTTSSQQGACVNETQEAPSFRERVFQRVTGGRTQNRENISGRKEDSTTGPSQAKRHKTGLLLTIAVITVLCLAAGIKLRERQLLHWAVRNGHIRISQALLKFVSDVDAPNVYGETPLHVAAKNGYKDVAELLMKLGSNVNSKDYQQQTPLHLAAWSGYQEIVNALIRHGIDVKARDDSQQTALHLAALNGHKNVLQVLIQSGSDVNAEQRLGWTPLHLAALAGHKEIGEVLVRHGSVINIGDNLGYTPLHLAAVKGHIQMVQFLIKRGSDVEARSGEFQLSALHGAAIFGHKQIVELLIHHGSDVKAGNNYSCIPLHHGSDVKAGNNYSCIPLHLAVYNFRRNIAEVLIQNGSDVNARDIFGQTPLHLAARSGDQEITEFLIEQGSELNAQDNSQQTALHLAAQNGHRNVAEVLLRYGSDVNVRNKFGLTPLHLAVLGGHEQIIEVFLHLISDVDARDALRQIAALSKTLIRYQSNGNATDIFGQTSLHLAVRNGGKNVTEVLCQVWYGIRAMLGDTPLHLDAFSAHRELTELLRHGSGGQAVDDHLPNNDVNLRNNRRQSPLHLAAENDYKHICDGLTHHGSGVNTKDNFGKTPLHLVTINRHERPADILGKRHRRLLNTTELLRQTRYKFDPRGTPVVGVGTFLKHLEIGRSLQDLLQAEVYHTLTNNETNFLQTSCEPIHQETQFCLASDNLSIGLRDDVSGPRDHKLILDKPLMTQCLNISLCGGDGITGNINPIPVMKCHGSRSRYTSLIDHPAYQLHPTKFTTNGRPKDRDDHEAKYSNKVLIRRKLPLKVTANGLLILFLIALTLHVTLKIVQILQRLKQMDLKWTILPVRSGRPQRRHYPVAKSETMQFFH